MNSLCINFFFYIFLSGSILFTILGVFSGSGNPVLLLENSQFNDKNEPIEEPGLKKRVTIQYFIAAFLDLCFSIVFLKFIFSSNKSSKNIDNNFEEPKIEKIKNKNIEEAQEINTNSINNEDINNINNDSNQIQGMSEKY